MNQYEAQALLDKSIGFLYYPSENTDKNGVDVCGLLFSDIYDGRDLLIYLYDNISDGFIKLIFYINDTNYIHIDFFDLNDTKILYRSGIFCNENSLGSLRSVYKKSPNQSSAFVAFAVSDGRQVIIPLTQEISNLTMKGYSIVELQS